MYKLGQFLAKYYFDSGRIKNRSPKNVYVQSSDSVRCLQSVTLLLAGMFPPENDSKWNDNLGQIWQPIAVHTRPFKTDMVKRLIIILCFYFITIFFHST